jgi:hypothetical protein
MTLSGGLTSGITWRIYMVKVGDIVRCVDNSNVTRLLTKDKEYKVLEVNDDYIYVKPEDGSERGGFFHYRFELVRGVYKCLTFDKPDVAAEDGPGGSTPGQYELPRTAVELQDLIEYRDMNFAIGNIFKACYRMGNKNAVDKAYDLRKIIWFAKRELAQCQGGTNG